MASEKSELQWQNVDVAELSQDAQTTYAASKEAYKAYKAARFVFENTMNTEFAEHLDDSSELKFGYNFGKLSVAIGPKTTRKSKNEAPKQTLAEFLAAQNASGAQS